MVADAERFKEEDDAEAERIDAKNSFEGVVYGLRSMVQDDAMERRWLEDDQVQLSLLVEEAVSPFEKYEDWRKEGRLDEVPNRRAMLHVANTPEPRAFYRSDGLTLLVPPRRKSTRSVRP